MTVTSVRCSFQEQIISSNKSPSVYLICGCALPTLSFAQLAMNNLSHVTEHYRHHVPPHFSAWPSEKANISGLDSELAFVTGKQFTLQIRCQLILKYYAR